MDGIPEEVSVETPEQPPKENEEEEQQPSNTWRDLDVIAIVVIYVMPFFATIATRLPLIYFAIFLVDEFDVPLLSVGWFVAAYHGTRTLVIFLDMFFPKAVHFVGTLTGFVGFLALLFKKDHDSLPVFAICNIVVGLSEANAVVQVYAKREFSSDMASLRFALRTQSAVVGVAVILGFFLGGLMFDAFGVDGIAITGVIVLGIELVALSIYLFADRFMEYYHVDGSVEYNQSVSMPSSTPSHRSLASEDSQQRVHNAIKTGKVRESLMNDFSASTEVKRNNIIYVVASAFTVESMTVGYVFAIGPLFIKEEFGQSEAAIGYMFSSASLWGTILTLLVASNKGQDFVRKHLPSPFNLYTFLIVISISMFLATIPIFPIHIVAILFIVGGNELFLTVLTEIQGTITTQQFYSVLGPMAQFGRRFLYIIAAITAPLLGEIYIRLPYLMSGMFSACFSALIIYKIERHRRKNARELAEAVGMDRDACGALDPKRFSFATQEIMARINDCSQKNMLDELPAIGEEEEEEEEEGADTDGSITLTFVSAPPTEDLTAISPKKKTGEESDDDSSSMEFEHSSAPPIVDPNELSSSGFVTSDTAAKIVPKKARVKFDDNLPTNPSKKSVRYGGTTTYTQHTVQHPPVGRSTVGASMVGIGGLPRRPPNRRSMANSRSVAKSSTGGRGAGTGGARFGSIRVGGPNTKASLAQSLMIRMKTNTILPPSIAEDESCQ